MTEDDLQFITDEASGHSGIWLKGRLFYCQLPLKRPLLFINSSARLARRLIVALVFALALLGWAALVWWIYDNFAVLAADPFQSLLFFKDKHPLLGIFFISLWCDLFLIYSRSEAAAARRKIPYYHLGLNKAGQFKKTGAVNIAETLDDESRAVVEKAFFLADHYHQPLNPRHLFRILITNREIQNLLIRLEVDPKVLLEKLDKHLNDGNDQDGTAALKNKEASGDLSSAVQEIIIRAFIDAFSRQQEAVTILDLVWYCYGRDQILSEILYDFKVDNDKIDNAVQWFRVNNELAAEYKSYRRMALLKPGNNMNRAYTAIATPNLDHFSSDRTLAAKYGRVDYCVDRAKEINAIFDAFSGGHFGVLLVGPNGAGRKTIVDGLARLMVAENVPDFLKDKRLIEIDTARLVAGATAAEAEERLLICLDEASRAGNIILYIADVERIIGLGAGNEGSFDLSEVLAQAVSHQEVFCLTTASSENYAHFIENRPLGEAMTTVGVSEPDVNLAIQILESKASLLESQYGIFMTYSAIEQAVILSKRYIKDSFLPLKAVNLLQAAVVSVAKASHHNPSAAICTGDSVAVVIAEKTGIPANKISEDESRKLLDLEKNIHQRLVGQNEAVKAVAAALRRARAEMRDTGRPIASFLFLGPTGVGKTELAKTVSEVYFGREDYMIRLDMSEYQEADSVAKMIGDEKGVLGYLTEAVRKKPFSLILFDEIEKAHPDILNLFLQLLDDGRLTDGQGRTISFVESIIIATSNIGAVYIQDQIKAGVSDIIVKQDLVDNQLNKYLKPELINRFDGIVVFKPLAETEIFEIATLLLKKTKKKLADQGINFKADKDGVLRLAKEGYDPKFGARPLRRLLQEKVDDEIATKILSGQLKRRDTVFIDSKGAIGTEVAVDL
jgi:ATP-dependent Clp protease ATP-binding subunit ClpC